MQITKDKVLCILLCAGLGGLYNAHQNYLHTGHDLTHRWSFSFVQTFTQCAWMVCIHHAVTALCCSITSHISSHVEGIGLCCNPRLFPSEASCSIFMKSGSKVEGLSSLIHRSWPSFLPLAACFSILQAEKAGWEHGKMNELY